MAVTIYDVASRAHVSVTTISKILNNKDNDISSATRDKVLKIIEDMEFVPSALARSMVTKKTNTLGLVIPSVSNEYFAEIASGVEKAANSLGYTVIFCNTDESEEREKECLHVLQEKCVDGIIMVPTRDSNENNQKQLKFNTPYVLIDRVFDSFTNETIRVSFDNIQGGYMAGRYLLSNGHRKIGLIVGATTNKQSNDRIKGFKKALNEKKIELDEDLIFYGDYGYQSGSNAAEFFFNKDVTAVFSLNDYMAIGFFKYYRSHKKSIPKDISIMGYDDISMSAITDPGLTTISQPKIEMGRVAALNLINCILSKSYSKDIIFEPELVERDSVRRI